MMQFMKAILFLISLSVYPSACFSMYMRWGLDDASYNTNGEGHYNNLVNYTSMRQRLSQSTGNPNYTKWMTEIDEHQQIMEDVRQLPVGGGWAVIHPEWVISANHVLTAQFVPHAYYEIKLSNGFVCVFDRVYSCPVGGVDMALGHLAWPMVSVIPGDQMSPDRTNPPPVSIFRGSAQELSQYKIYACSDALHSNGGGLSLPLAKEKNITTYGKCLLGPGQNFEHIVTSMMFDHSGSFQTFSHGGDSGGPVIVKIDSTGDLSKDYRIIGVYNPTGAGLTLMSLLNAQILNWVDNVIDSEASGNPLAPTKQLCDFVKQ
jgi:hypothetical protein